MKPRFFPLLLFVALAGSLGAVRAEKADRGKPMHIEADALRHDELRQTSVFSGRVLVTQGSIVLRGARLDLRQDADGFQYGVLTAEAGGRAFFRQKRDTPAGAPEEFIEGEGERIEYDGKAERLRFIARAELRRYRAAVLGDEITGALIVYDRLSDVFTVDGQRSAVASSGAAPGKADAASAPQGGRVRAVLTPKAPAAAASTPAPPASAAPVLRPSQRLGGVR